MENFAPKGFDRLDESRYWRMKEMKTGENVFRIVAPFISGWVDWTEDNKPLRYRFENKPLTSINPKKPVQGFYSFLVWDYEREGLYILTVTQKTVRNAIAEMIKDPALGDARGYDIKLLKTGKEKATTYMVIPGKKTPISDQIKEQLSKTTVNLEALFDNGDPWKEGENAPILPAASTLEGLAKVLSASISVPYPDYLIAHMEYVKGKTSKTMDEVVAGWLEKPEVFLKFYRSWVDKEISSQNKGAVVNS